MSRIKDILYPFNRTDTNDWGFDTHSELMTVMQVIINCLVRRPNARYTAIVADINLALNIKIKDIALCHKLIQNIDKDIIPQLSYIQQDFENAIEPELYLDYRESKFRSMYYVTLRDMYESN